MEKRRQYSYRKCAICGARKLPNSNTYLSSFPLDPDRCRLWVKAAGDEDLIHLPIEKLHELKFLCGSHFAPECFNMKGNRLLKTAVPTKRLTKPLLSDESLKEFPVHVKSFYDRLKKKPEFPHKINSDKKCQSEVISCSSELNNTLSNTQTASGQGLFHNVTDNEQCQRNLISHFSEHNRNNLGTATATDEGAIYRIISINDEQSQMELTSCLPEHNETSYNLKIASGQENSVNPFKCSKECAQLKTELLKMTEKCKILNQKLRKASRLAKTKFLLKAVEKLPEPAAIFTKMQLKKCLVKPKGRRFSYKEKVFCLSIYKESQVAYKLMQRLFALPSNRTIQRIALALADQKCNEKFIKGVPNLPD